MGINYLLKERMRSGLWIEEKDKKFLCIKGKDEKYLFIEGQDKNYLWIEGWIERRRKSVYLLKERREEASIY